MTDVRIARVLFVACAGLTLVALGLGLTGPDLLDDTYLLKPIRRAASGDLSWISVLAQGAGGPLGRPVTLASFGANAMLCGGAASCLRAGNIALHLVNAVLMAQLAARLCRRDPATRADAAALGWLAAAIWLALSLHVPTVLYVSQRFALLSATFVLAGLLTFAAARERMDRGTGGAVLLWLGVPAWALLAVLAKENGALLPLLCLALELALFAPAAGRRRPASVRWFFGLGVLVPAVLATFFLVTHPERLGDFGQRHFTLWERVLTQGRVLWDYAAATFLPSPVRSGIFQDDYVVSRGLLDPWTTAAAWAAWLVIAGSVVAGARRLPLVAAGFGLFVAGHVMESSVFALEIYFAHRNYLPSAGLVLMAVGAVAALRERMPVMGRRAVAVAGCTWLLLSFATTWSMASAWSDEDTLLAYEQALHPRSLRVRVEQITNALERGNAESALQAIDEAAALARPDERRDVALWRLLAMCESRGDFSERDLERVSAIDAERIAYNTTRALDALVDRVEPGRCAPERRLGLARLVQRWLASSVQDATNTEMAEVRYLHARLLASGGEMRAAQREARHAFESRRDFRFGVLAFQISASLGDTAACRAILEELERITDWRNPERRGMVDKLAASLQTGSGS